MKSSIKYSAIGIVAGFLNGLFGAGGGIIVVPLLEKCDISEKKSHATSIAIIASLSLLSAIIYLVGKEVNLTDALWFIPTGIIGAFLGSFLLKKINADLLRRIFGIVMIISGVRLLLK